MGNLGNRLFFAALGAFFGAIMAGICWLLYGCGLSVRLNGNALDPFLTHWLYGLGGGLAVLGFILEDKMANALGDLISVVFYVQLGETPDRHGKWGYLFWVVLAILVVCALTYWTSPDIAACAVQAESP